jgi:hypothetical protein
LKLEDLEKLFPEGFPLLKERTQSLNELGLMIINVYENKYENFLTFNNYDCLEVNLIIYIFNRLFLLLSKM